MAIKIGILSMQRICNYGSFLQAYCLKKILEELGCTVDFIDYHPGKCVGNSEKNLSFFKKLIKIKDIFEIKAALADKIRYINHKRCFAKKNHSYLGITESFLYCPDVDIVIIGSDEVFNCIQNNPNVGFTPELFGVGQISDKVITYAASFGNTTISKLEKYNIKEKVSDWLNLIDTISVRDENSRLIVKQLTGRDPSYNLDPVLVYDLVEKYRQRPLNISEEDYLLLYGYSGRFTKNECEVIRAYARENNCKILCIGGYSIIVIDLLNVVHLK